MTIDAGQSGSCGAEVVPERPHCYRCHKPVLSCVCNTLTSVANRTFVHVLQHPRERFHPIGTARFLKLGLEQSRVDIWDPSGPAPVFPEGAALLYPGPGSRDLDTMPAHERPRHLVVIDGTWSHAKNMYRDTPYLQTLPTVRLLPRVPSRYRLRKEPHAHCVSTVEAVVQTLSVIEPETTGLDGLITAFMQMIDRQVELREERPRRPYKRRARVKRPQVPPVLLQQTNDLVVCYGEFVRRGDVSHLVYWTAQRLLSGELFSQLVQPSVGLPDDAHLRNMGLSRDELLRAPNLTAFAESWRAFSKPNDVLIAWNQSVIDLIGALVPPTLHEPVLLKGAYCNFRKHASGMLEEVVEREGLTIEANQALGRAQQRLGQALALTRLLTTA